MRVRIKKNKIMSKNRSKKMRKRRVTEKMKKRRVSEITTKRVLVQEEELVNSFRITVFLVARIYIKRSVLVVKVEESFWGLRIRVYQVEEESR